MKPKTMEELEKLRKNSNGGSISGPAAKGRIQGNPIQVKIIPKAERIQKILEEPGRNFYRR